MATTINDANKQKLDALKSKYGSWDAFYNSSAYKTLTPGKQNEIKSAITTYSSQPTTTVVSTPKTTATGTTPVATTPKTTTQTTTTVPTATTKTAQQAVDSLLKKYGTSENVYNSEAYKKLNTQQQQKIQEGFKKYTPTTTEDKSSEKGYTTDTRLTSGLGSIDASLAFTQEQSKKMEDSLNSFKEESNKIIASLAQTNTEISNNLTKIAQDRINNVNSTFSNIQEQLNQLKEVTLAAYDINAGKSAEARANALAEAGIITSAQASMGAKNAVASYIRDANLKRLDIEKEINTQLINAENEKKNALDSIMQQQGVDETTKQKMASDITTLYNNVISTYTNNLTSLNNSYMQTQNSLVSGQQNADVEAYKTKLNSQINSDLSQMDQNRLKTDSKYRYDFVTAALNSLGLNDVTSYAMKYINFNDPDIYNNLGSMITDAALKGLEDYKKEQERLATLKASA